MVVRAVPPGFEGKSLGWHLAGGRVPSKPGTPQAWLDQVEMYLEFRQNYSQEWMANEKIYDADPMQTSYEERGVRLGRAYGLMQTLASSLINSRPKLFVNDLTGEAPQEAELYEHLINADWTFHDDAFAEATNAVMDAAIYGFGVVMTTYESSEGLNVGAMEERAAQVLAAKQSQTLEELQDLRVAEAMTDGLPDPMLTHERDARALTERVATRRVSPWDILLDPTARRFSELRWIGRRLELARQDLQDGPYNQEAVRKISHDLGGHSKYWHTSKKRLEHMGAKFRGESENWVVVYEIWDVINQELIVISPSNAEHFLRQEPNPYHLRHPFQIESWTARGEFLLPRSDLSAIRNYIDEEEALRDKTRQAFLRERYDVVFAAQELGLGNEEIAASTMPDGSMIIPVKASSQDLRNGLVPYPRSAKTPDSMMYLEKIKQEINDTLHIGPNQMGSALKSETSATEAAAIRDYASQKAAFRYEAVNRLVESIAFARLSLMAQFYDERHILLLAGKGGARDWAGIRFTPGDIHFRFRVKVDPGSMNPQNEFQRAQVFQEMLQQALTVPALGQLYNIPNILASWLEARGIRDLSQYLNIPEDIKTPKQLADLFKAQLQATPTNSFDQSQQQRNGVGSGLMQSEDVASDLQAAMGAQGGS